MPGEPYTGPLPTIGHDRAYGVRSIRIICLGRYCGHSSVIEIERLELPDEVPIIHIPRRRCFVCSRCGSHEVETRSVWPTARGSGAPMD
jgi:hypothetical protein